MRKWVAHHPANRSARTFQSARFKSRLRVNHHAVPLAQQSNSLRGMTRSQMRILIPTTLLLRRVECSLVDQSNWLNLHEQNHELRKRASHRRKSLPSQNRPADHADQAPLQVELLPSRRRQLRRLPLLRLLYQRSPDCHRDRTCSEVTVATYLLLFDKEQSCARLTILHPVLRHCALPPKLLFPRLRHQLQRRRSAKPSRTQWCRDASMSSTKKHTQTTKTRTTTGTRRRSLD